MSLTVEKIMNLLPSSYRIRLVAGKGGLCRSDINWVSLVEDYDTEKFRNINQIVITAGINMKCEEELAEYVKNLHEARTAALILNVGKYIKKVDDEIINFCNKVDLPLYTMPWDVLMSDLVRDISKILILNEKNKKSIFELIQSIVFNTGNINKHINELCMYGFSEEMYYCPIIIKSQHDGIETIPDMALKSLKTVFENSISKIRDAKMIMFTYNRKIAVVVAYYNKGDVEKYVDDISKNIGAGGFFNHRITLFVGKQNDMLNRLSVNFKRLNQFLNFSSKKDFDVVYYDKMGIYKLIADVGDTELLKEFYDDSIGKLKKYDRENSLNFTEYLKSYIEYDGSVIAVAKNFYVHRNTVNNYLKKIEEITGINPLTVEGKFIFLMAMKIERLFDIQ